MLRERLGSCSPGRVTREPSHAGPGSTEWGVNLLWLVL